MLLAGCGTIYTPVYSPRKSNYRKPPEKKEASGAELLPTPPVGTPPSQTAPIQSDGGLIPPAQTPSMGDSSTIPGL
jgi:hypothetical protein